MSNEQYGFRKGQSTEYALMRFINDTVVNLNNNVQTLAVYVDFTKAFYSVNHQILISKMEHYGIRGNPLKLLTSYLTDIHLPHLL